MAKGVLQKIAKRILLIINIFFCVIFLLACLAPLLNPHSWWFMSFLGLILPYLGLALLLWILFWWFIRPKYSLISIIVLLIGYKQIGVLFALNSPAAFNEKKQAEVLRIADWNIRSFVGVSSNREKQKLSRTEIADALTRLNADVLCLQEFNHSFIKETGNNLSLFASLYPYYYFSRDFQRDGGRYASGCIIFSKYPMLNTGKVKYPGKFSESLIYADILKDSDTIRIYTTHLLSFRFNKTDYDGMDRMKEDPETLAASKSIIRKMKHAFTQRGLQADMARSEIDKSPFPSVLCGDFNDVPNSYTYFRLKGIRKDAFLQKSLGIGRTYLSLAPTLRIDYILPGNEFDVLQFDMIDENLSDHLLLVTDLKLKK